MGATFLTSTFTTTHSHLHLLPPLLLSLHVTLFHITSTAPYFFQSVTIHYTLHTYTNSP